MKHGAGGGQDNLKLRTIHGQYLAFPSTFYFNLSIGRTYTDGLYIYIYIRYIETTKLDLPFIRT